MIACVSKGANLLANFQPRLASFRADFQPRLASLRANFQPPRASLHPNFQPRRASLHANLQPRLASLNHFLKRICKGKSSPKWRKMLPKHHSQLIMLPWQCDLRRFTILSCKTKKYFARSRSSEEPWRSHSTVICRDWDAKRNRIIRTSATQIAAPKQDLDAQAEERRVWSTL